VNVSSHGGESLLQASFPQQSNETVPLMQENYDFFILVEKATVVSAMKKPDYQSWDREQILAGSLIFIMVSAS